MSGPFIFIATNQLRSGKLAAERERAIELSAFIESTEPQLLAFNEYASEDGAEVSVVQVHPDAASMEFHMETVAERAARAYTDTLEATADRTVRAAQRDARVAADAHVLGHVDRAQGSGPGQIGGPPVGSALAEAGCRPNAANTHRQASSRGSPIVPPWFFETPAPLAHGVR